MNEPFDIKRKYFVQIVLPNMKNNLLTSELYSINFYKSYYKMKGNTNQGLTW